MIILQHSGAAARQSRLSWQNVERNFNILLAPFIFLPLLLNRAVISCLTAKRNDKRVQSQSNIFKYTTTNPGNVWSLRNRVKKHPLLPSRVLCTVGKYSCNLSRMWRGMLSYLRGFYAVTKGSIFQYACQLQLKKQGWRDRERMPNPQISERT